MSNRGFLAVLAAVGFVGLLAFGLLAKDGATIAVGEPAPDAPVDRLSGPGQASLADYRGQWVLLNFWASWCDPCRDEAPTIERFSRENHGDVVVVGMDSRDLSGDAEDFAQEFGLTYELLHDGEGDRMDDYGIKALPESYLVDPEGNLAFIYRGPVDQKILDQQIEPLIKGEGAQ